MIRDGVENLRYSDDPDQNREVLFKMAEVYRNLQQHECRLINHRTTWFLTLNGFLFAAFGIILAYYKGSHAFLILVSFVFATMGCLLAMWVYKSGIVGACWALCHVQKRWIEFLEVFFGSSLQSPNVNCYIPPITAGLLRERDDYASENLRKLKEEKPDGTDRLAYVMTGAWIALFIVVFFFNTIPCLQQSVSKSSVCPIPHVSQDSTSNLININYDSNVEITP